MRPRDAVALWQQGIRVGWLMAEAQMVMGLRIAGLAGAWPLPRGEARRMVAEKPPAFFEAWRAWQRAALAGSAPWVASAAYTRPLARKTAANHRRLTT